MSLTTNFIKSLFTKKKCDQVELLSDKQKRHSIFSQKFQSNNCEETELGNRDQCLRNIHKFSIFNNQFLNATKHQLHKSIKYLHNFMKINKNNHKKYNKDNVQKINMNKIHNLFTAKTKIYSLLKISKYTNFKSHHYHHSFWSTKVSSNNLTAATTTTTTTTATTKSINNIHSYEKENSKNIIVHKYTRNKNLKSNLRKNSNEYYSYKHKKLINNSKLKNNLLKSDKVNTNFEMNKINKNYFFPISMNNSHHRLINFTIHKELIFGQIISDQLWDIFEFMLDTQININSCQKIISTNENNVINNIDLLNHSNYLTYHYYSSLLDLFLNCIQLHSNKITLNKLFNQNLIDTNEILNSQKMFPKLLSNLLDKGANVQIIYSFNPVNNCHTNSVLHCSSSLLSNSNLNTNLEGIRLQTIINLCENIALQINCSSLTNAQNQLMYIDYAGLMRQLLNSGLKPNRKFFINYSKQIIITNKLEIILSNLTMKQTLYPMILIQLVKWYLNKSHSNTTNLPIVLQSFIVLLFNLIYAGLCELPQNFQNLINISNEFYKTNLKYYQLINIFQKFHKIFLDIINYKPINLYVLTRYYVRNQLLQKYFHQQLENPEKFFNSNFINNNINNNNHNYNTNNCIINHNLSTNFLIIIKQINQLPEQLKYDLGYMESFRLRNELNCIVNCSLDYMNQK